MDGYDFATDCIVGRKDQGIEGNSGHLGRMIPVDDLISELGLIRNALGEETVDPSRRPRRRGPRESPASERVSGDPIFDSGQWDVTDPDLWEEEKQRARRAVEGDGSAGQSGISRTGIEALAWYVSFHDDQRAWGVYIPLSSLALMDELYLSNLRIGRDRRLNLAWSALLFHEQMHFAVDYACAWFELVLRAPTRREFMARFKGQLPFAGLTPSEAYLEIEEAAANAHMLRQLVRKESRQVMRTIEGFVARQPPGYKEGLRATSDASFAEATAETLRSYFAIWAIEHRLDFGNPKTDWLRLLPLDDESAGSECPVYVINDLDEIGMAAGSLRLIQCISEIVETADFERQFRRQDAEVRSDWGRKKEEIKIRLPSPPRFEKLKDWKPPTWSLRLRAGHRAHLRPPDPGMTAWRAVAIGNHKEMGHG
ncbi:MAG TPA: hypothetical protein VH592_19155 [Gemmataceae bacterium]